MKTTLLVSFALSCLVAFAFTASAQPTTFTYQGHLTASGTNFNGAGHFKFALVTGTNTAHQATATAMLSGQFVTGYNVTSGGNGYVSPPAVTISGGGGSGASAHTTLNSGAVNSVVPDQAGSNYVSTPTVTIAPPPPAIVYTTFWSNDGTSANGSEPSAAVPVPINNGLFTVVLGDTTLANMEAIDASLFNQPNLQLRIWFSDNGSSFSLLDPPQPLTAAPYSDYAVTSSNITGQILASQLSGPIANNQLASNSITLNPGTGLSGGGTVALGGTTTFNNTGVTSVTSSNGITVSAANGAVTISSTATTNNVPNSIVMRDSNGNLSASNVTVSGALNLASTAASIQVEGFQFLSAPGTQNAFVGNAGNLSVTGGQNVGVGSLALAAGTTASRNTAVGVFAQFETAVGSDNVAVGYAALGHLTNGSVNTAVGDYSLSSQQTGNYNTAFGYGTGVNISTGTSDIIVGPSAGLNLTTGSTNIMIGLNAGSNISTGNGNIDIGNAGFGNESDVIRIGTAQTKAVMVGIYGMTVNSGTPVYVNASGLLGTATSSARFKTNIQDMASTSDDILKLRPVTFNYKKDIDPDAVPQFGLIAEEVQKVNPNLIVRDPQGRPYTVRYDAVNAMLLNEFLKEHHKVEQLEKDLSEIKATLAKVAARLN